MSETVKHPAKFTEEIIAVAARYLKPGWIVLDPFGGVGRVFELHRHVKNLRIEMIELEPEWARQVPVQVYEPGEREDRVYVDDCLKLMASWGPEIFDAIVTSPTYGNRMADTYDGRDGSRRHTYRTYLGRELSANSSAGMQWGKRYQEFHYKAWGLAVELLKPGGVFVLNCKNHIRQGKVQRVVEWHTSTLRVKGLEVIAIEDVDAPGMREGENGDARLTKEKVVVLRKPIEGQGYVG